MKEKLTEFFKHYFSDDTKRLLETANRSNASFLLADYIKEIDKEEYKKIRAQKKVQKLFYEKTLEEIEILTSEFDKAGIKLVFVKGVFLAKDLYEDISERHSQDIDVSIPEEDFERAHVLLKSLGYTCCDFTDEEIEADKHIEYWKEQHICYEKMNKSYKIYVEVHGNIVNAGEAFDFNTKEFLDNAEKTDILGMQPYLLKPEYNLLYLILHFFKHIPLSYTHYSILGIKTEINLGALTDIALFIRKHKIEIEWDRFIGLCTRMQVVKYVLVTIKLMNDIYPDSFHTTLIEELKKKESYTHLNELKYERCGWGKYVWLMDETIDVLLNHHLSEILRGTLLDYIDMNDIAQRESAHQVDVKDTCRFEQAFSLEFDGKEGLSESKLCVSVDKEKLDVTYTVKNKGIVCYEGEKNAFNRDGIDILAATPDKIRHKLFTIAKEGEEYYLVESSQDYVCENINRISESFYKAKLEVSDKDCFIGLSVPWKELGVDTNEQKTVSFNVAGLMTDPNTKEYTGNYQLFDNKNDMFDFRYMPVLHF